MIILFAQNILDYIVNFEKKYDVVFSQEIKNYLFNEIFEFQIKKYF